MADSSINIEMFGGYDAAIPSPNRAPRFWPTLDSRKQVDAYDLAEMSRQARSLEVNMPAVAMVVQTMVDLMGWLQPMPATSDEEWNVLARRLFERRFSLGGGFDISGRLSWESAQEWIERAALIDGDCLIVKSRADDGSARFAFYEAPQLYNYGGENGQPGVITDKRNRVLYYLVTGADGNVHYIPGYAGFLYSQHKSPLRVRSVSEIGSAITNAADIQDIQAFTKAGIKFANSYSVIETKDKDAIKAAAQTAWLQAQGVDVAESDSTSTTGESSSSTVADYPAPVPPGMGDLAPRFANQVVSLGPGRDLKILHDTRPSNETRSFMDQLTGTLAMAIGLDPAVVFNPEKLGSASARYTLQKMRRTIKRRLVERSAFCLWVWRHFIACEIDAGRLPVCQDPEFDRVRWVPLRDLTIDAGREISGQINAVREGLADADEWTMATAGKTQKEILSARAETLAFASQLATEKNIPLGLLLAGALGATSPTPETTENGGVGHAVDES